MSVATHSLRSPTAAQKAEFRCVPLAVFRLYRNISVNLYTKSETQAEPVLYRSSSIPITEADLATLTERGHRALYIAAGDLAKFNAMLNDTLHLTLENADFSREDRYSVLQAAASLQLDVAFAMIRCDRFVELTHRIARQITTLLVGDEVVPRTMFNMLQHDFYTFTHITNVAGFATLLADGLGYTDPVVREQIAVGALLHDIGKRFIPASVLNKTSRLTDDDWNLIRIHPQRGYEDLCDRDDVNEGQLLMVYSHHERIDGAGYPVGMVGDEIHPWARLLAVVDVFDAITSARPYRVPMPVSHALEYLQRNAGSHFDPEMVSCWTSMMKKR